MAAMIRLGSTRWKAFVLATVMFGAPAAHAQTFEERFSALGLRTTAPATTFVAPAQTPPEPATAAPGPRPDAPRAAVSAARAAPPAMRARQEELLVAAYAPQPSAADAPQSPFASWLPRLLPTAVEPAETAASVADEAASIDRGIVSERRRHARRVPNDLAALIAAKAHKHGVPIQLAHAVVTVESNYNPRALGRGATIGLMQIKHPTARSLGFAGTVQELYDPAVNLEYGMDYLGKAHRLAKGDICGTIMRYQGGLRAPRMSRDAVVYCARVQKLLAADPKTDRIAAEPARRRVAETVRR